MCSNPLDVGGGVSAACRKCNECVSTRLQSWVARAMAEKAVSPFTYAVTLTYGSDTQAKRDGAEAFRYSDVRLFMAGLRAAIYRQTGRAGAVRFICCGERGSDKGRVHWHIVLFSDFDLLDLGEWRVRGQLYSGEKVSTHEKKIRLNWSLWPHGFSQFEVPNDNGMAYCLKYALKDQFSVKRSEGTGRISKAENYASSYFRMSKAPPIGHAWLWGELQALFDRGAIPVALKFKPPLYWGFWWPSDLLRVDLLRAIRQYVDQAAVEPPQLRAFLASLSEQDRDIYYGEEGEDEDDEGYEAFAASRKRALCGREFAQRAERSAIRRKCGGFAPCAACRNALGTLEIQDCDQYAKDAEAECAASGLTGADAQAVWADRQRVANPFCLCRAEGRVKNAFEERVFGERPKTQG